ncbi:MAG: energy transducer TonB, partial [Bryobacteraceae bacterium]
PHAYPPLARQQRVSGVVRLEVTIGEDGTVQRPRVLSGHLLLQAGLLDNVRQWVYEPALVNGRPVPVTTQVEVKFNLETRPQ